VSDLRATLTSERESGLVLMNIHYGRQIDVGATIDIFAQNRNIFLGTGRFESSIGTNGTVTAVKPLFIRLDQ